MKHNELSKFTYAELSHFTHAELELGKLELLETAKLKQELPDEIIEKLILISRDAISSNANLTVSLPTDKKATLKTALEILKITISVPTAVKATVEVINLLKTMFL